MAEFSNLLLSSLILPNYVLSQYYIRPRTSRDDSIAIINSKPVHHTYYVSSPALFHIRMRSLLS